MQCMEFNRCKFEFSAYVPYHVYVELQQCTTVFHYIERSIATMTPFTQVISSSYFKLSNPIAWKDKNTYTVFIYIMSRRR
jgi:hypothetical protein